MIREIVKIDEDLCNGCGECVPGCHEGALQIIDGKARLISELMCDGLGACIGHCPEGAITIEEREAEPYDEAVVISQMVKKGKNTVFAHLKHLQDHGEMAYLREATTWLRANREILPFSIAEVHELLTGSGSSQSARPGSGIGCPGSAAHSFAAGSGIRIARQGPEQQQTSSELTQWPVQLHLINPAASYFHDADLLVAADCAAFAHGDFHRKFIKGKKLVIACPKLDNSYETYVQKLIRLTDEAKVNTITVVVMEVPCCSGLVRMVRQATQIADRRVPVKAVTISIRGEILAEGWL